MVERRYVPGSFVVLRGHWLVRGAECRFEPKDVCVTDVTVVGPSQHEHSRSHGLDTLLSIAGISDDRADTRVGNAECSNRAVRHADDTDRTRPDSGERDRDGH